MSNWIDRGDALELALARVLGHAVGLAGDDPALREYALTIRGMVEADSTEVHVAGYLNTVTASLGQSAIEPTLRRTLAVALWHIAKAGLVRDQASRELAALRRVLPPPPPLAEQLRTAILGAPSHEPTREPVQPPMRHEIERLRER